MLRPAVCTVLAFIVEHGLPPTLQCAAAAAGLAALVHKPPSWKNYFIGAM